MQNRQIRFTLLVVALGVIGLIGWSVLTVMPATGAPAATFSLRQIAQGLAAPVYLTHAGDGSGRLFVVEKGGAIRIIQNGQVLAQPFLDISDRVGNDGEAGLLSVAFPPDYATNGYFFVYYNHADKNLVGPEPEDGGNNGGYDTVVARFRVTTDPNRADKNSEERILVRNQPFTNHNGGLLKFGPDGYLYVGLGDGGSGNDPYDTGQNINSLLGKILRINVNAASSGKSYAVPSDNPFVNTPGALPEIYAYGFRNPWRFSFDYSNGRLFVADVGQDNREEIDLVAKGGNYGWRVMEGDLCNPAINGSCNTSLYAPPLVAYPHSLGQSVIGGHVYRGTRYPALQGAYLYGDFSSGRVWGFFPNGQSAVGHRELLQTGFPITSFGQSYKGDLFILNLSGSVHLILPPSRFAGRR